MSPNGRYTPSATLAPGGYGAATLALGTPRSIEYRAFADVTGRLRRATAPGQSFAALAEALHRNLMLWTVLGSDLRHPDNALPPALRRDLLGLARFVRQHSDAVLRRDAEPGVLVEINAAVMAGLRGRLPPGQAPAEAPADAPAKAPAQTAAPSRRSP